MSKESAKEGAIQAAFFVFVVLFGLIVLAFVMAMPFDRSAAVFQNPEGHLEAGSKFGIQVGMPLAEAESRLSRSGMILSPLGPPLIDHCGGRVMAQDESLEFWADGSWRRGLICIFSRDDRTTAVGWSFNPLAP